MTGTEFTYTSTVSKQRTKTCQLNENNKWKKTIYAKRWSNYPTKIRNYRYYFNFTLHVHVIT